MASLDFEAWNSVQIHLWLMISSEWSQSNSDSCGRIGLWWERLCSDLEDFVCEVRIYIFFIFYGTNIGLPEAKANKDTSS